MAEEMDIKCRIIVPRPTNPEKAKEQDEIANALNQISEEDAREVDRGLKESIVKRVEQERMEKEIPQEIKDFRKKWEEEVERLDDETKNRIIEATNRIEPKIKIEPDGSRRIEMRIGWKEYRLLDVNTKTHTDTEYGASYEYSWMVRDQVKLWWMIWDNVDNRENKRLREYVKEKQKGWFRIPKIEEVRSFLNELWKEAGIKKEEDQIAMLMYLTGMYGWYWLSMKDYNVLDSQANSRSRLLCFFISRLFSPDSGLNFASLFMIACN